MQLIVDNSAGEMMPGDYASIHLQIAAAAHVLSVPSSALIFDAKGLSIATVDADNRVAAQAGVDRTRLGRSHRTRLRPLAERPRDPKPARWNRQWRRRCVLPARRRAARSPARRSKNETGLRAYSGPAAALTLLLGACSLAPPLKTPDVPTADAYKEIGPWTQAQPADRLPRDSWWTLYDNAELDELEKRLIAGNPTLAAALANYAQARALADQARAGLFPTLGLSASATRDREFDQRAAQIERTTPTYYNANTVGGSVSYELDLWGQIRNEVAAGEANAAASAADLENARLSLIAQLVDDYIQLRSLDRDSAILDETVKAYTRALEPHRAAPRCRHRPRPRRLAGADPARCRTLPGGADARSARADGTRDCGAARRVGLDVLDQAGNRRHHASADSHRRPHRRCCSAGRISPPRSGA